MATFGPAPTIGDGNLSIQMPSTGAAINSILVLTSGSGDNWQAGFVPLPVVNSASIIAGLGFTPANLVSPAFTGMPTAPTAATPTNTTQLATTAFVQAVVANAVTGLLDDKGPLNCSANPNYPAGLKGDCYHVTGAGKIGGVSGVSVEVGDLVACSADNAGGTQAAVGASWYVLEHNLVGAVLIDGALGTPTSGNLVNCTFPTLNQNTTGSAAKLTTPRTINGVAFDGTANIVIAAAGSTLTDAVTYLRGGTGLTTLGSALQVLRTNAAATAVEWATVSGGGGSGDVVGPASATDNAIARFDTTTGKLLQNSLVTIGDNGATKIVATSSGYTPGFWVSDANNTLGGVMYFEWRSAVADAKVKAFVVDSTGLGFYRMTDGGAGFVDTTADLLIANNGWIGANCVPSHGSFQIKQDSSLRGLTVSAVADDSFFQIYSNGSAFVLESTYWTGGSYQPISIRTNGAEQLKIDSVAITANLPIAVCGFTFATLPSASSRITVVRVTDRGQKLAYSDGTNWRFVFDNNIVS